jgi:hypothetical protein
MHSDADELLRFRVIFWTQFTIFNRSNIVLTNNKDYSPECVRNRSLDKKMRKGRR